ncbi:hypothetical protein ACQKP0_25705 [Heyndrickxia sp. NPDC080065]|uniref:hypothetical protein n=1 Tax=Heyndrickxia sp. NPDC080065 TaxID=3390568 RepID=UPI003CFEF43B
MDSSWELPFDVQGIRTIQFNYRDLDSVEEARNQLLDIIDFIHQNPDKISTPIHEGLDIESLRKSGSSEDRILGDLAIGIASIQERLNKIERNIYNENGVLNLYNNHRSAVIGAQSAVVRASKRNVNTRKAIDYLEEELINNKKATRSFEENK